MHFVTDLFLCYLNRPLPSLAMHSSMPRVKSLYHLLREARTNTTLPQDEVDRRRQSAAQAILADPRVSDQVRQEYGFELSNIFANAAWTTRSSTGREVQTIHNIGLSPPTPDFTDACEQIVDLYRTVVRPAIQDKSKVLALVGTLTEYVGNGEDPDNPTNTKFFRPDFNSSITPGPVPVGVHGNDPAGQAADVAELANQMAGSFELRRSDRADTKYRVALYTNVTFRIFHAPMEPIVGIGGRLAPKPPSFSRMRLYTPKGQDHLCLFACIKKALGLKGKVASIAKPYAKAARMSLDWLRTQGLNASKPRWPAFRSSLDEHAARIEEVYRIRLYLLVVDQEASALRGDPKTRLSVLQLYSPQRHEGPVVHILLTDESQDKGGNQYTHAHLIQMPDTTLNGVRCAHCDKPFSQERSRNNLHRCQGTGTLVYPGGPMARHMSVWDKIVEAGLSVEALRARHHIMWRVDVADNGQLGTLWASCNGPHPDRRTFTDFSEFYIWAMNMRQAHFAWWLSQSRALCAQLTNAGLDHLANKVKDYGRLLPCVAMPLDLKATSHLWLPHAVDRRVIRVAGNYRAAETTHGLHFLTWAAYEKADTAEWKDCWPDASPSESLDLLEEAWARREEDLRSMPGGKTLELFRGNISLPNVARYLGYKTAESQGHAFYLPKGADEGRHVEGTLRRNMAGGPSVVFDRVVDDRKVLTYDANSLYAWAMSQDMPVGRHLFELDENGLRVLGRRQCSLGERSWIQSLRDQGIRVDTADELPTRRMRVRGASGRSYIPDGINRQTRTVYEFLGDHWHGGENRQATEDKIRDMEEAGWRVVTMWESEWSRPDRLDQAAAAHYPPYVYQYYRKRGDSAPWLAPDRVTRAIVDDVLFGFAVVDIEWAGPVPPPPFPGIFYKDGEERLANSHTADGVLLYTPYLQVLLTRGYGLTKVHRVWEFHRGRPFATFVDRAVAERQKNTPAAATWKLLVNSFYGGLIMNKRGRQTMRRTTGDLDRGLRVLDLSFRDLDHRDGSGTACVFRLQSTVLMNAPTHLGKAVLDLAKAHMVAFYHDVILPAGGVMVSMDTDSFTFHLDRSARLLDLVPRPLRELWFDDPDDPERWGPKVRGTPGLFHLESKGNSARAVGPKRVCVTGAGVPVKLSHTGVKREALPGNPMPLYDAMCRGIPVAVTYPERRRVAGKYVMKERHVTMSASITVSADVQRADAAATVTKDQIDHSANRDTLRRMPS